MAEEKEVLDIEVRLENAQSVRELKQLLKEAKDNAIKFGQGTPEFEKFTKVAGKAKDEISDLNKRVELLDPGGKAKAFVAAGQVIAGGFAAAQGAAALFGAENENITKALLKVQAATAVLQGIQAAHDGLEQAGAIRSIIFSKSKLAALNAESAAIGKGTVMQRIFNAVSSVSPFAWIAIAIGAVVLLYEKFEGVRKIMSSILEFFKPLAQFLGIMASNESEAADAAKEHTAAVEKQNAIQKDRIRIMAATGASVDQVNDAERKLMLTKKTAVAEEIRALKVLEASNSLTKDQKDRLSELRGEYTGLVADLSEFEKKIVDDQKKKNDEKRDAHQSYLKGIKSDQEKADDEGRHNAEEYANYQLDIDKKLIDAKVANIKDETERTMAEKKLALERELEGIYGDTEAANNLRKELTEKYNTDIASIQLKATEDLLSKLDEERDKDFESAQQHTEKEKQLYLALNDAKLQAVTSGLDAIGAIGDAFIKNEKTRAILQVAIDEAKSIAGIITAIIAANAQTPTPATPFIIASQIAGGIATLASNFARVKKILGSSSSTPSAPSLSQAGGGASITPTLINNGNTQNLQSQSSRAGQSPAQAFKAYVVESDHRRVTDRLNELEKRRTM